MLLARLAPILLCILAAPGAATVVILEDPEGDVQGVGAPTAPRLEDMVDLLGWSFGPNVDDGWDMMFHVKSLQDLQLIAQEHRTGGLDPTQLSMRARLLVNGTEFEAVAFFQNTDTGATWLGRLFWQDSGGEGQRDLSVGVDVDGAIIRLNLPSSALRSDHVELQAGTIQAQCGCPHDMVDNIGSPDGLVIPLREAGPTEGPTSTPSTTDVQTPWDAALLPVALLGAVLSRRRISDSA